MSMTGHGQMATDRDRPISSQFPLLNRRWSTATLLLTAMGIIASLVKEANRKKEAFRSFENTK